MLYVDDPQLEYQYQYYVFVYLSHDLKRYLYGFSLHTLKDTMLGGCLNNPAQPQHNHVRNIQSMLCGM